MADDPPRGWPYQPADPDGRSPRPRQEPPPWAQPPPEDGSSDRSGVLLEPPGSERPGRPGSTGLEEPGRPGGEGPGSPARPRDRRRLVIVAVVVLALLGVAIAVGLVASRPDDGGGGGGGRANGGRAVPSTAAVQPLPGTAVSVPPTPGIELTLLAGKFVVAARPGWEGLENAENNASVRLVLKDPMGRKLLSTLTIATLSGPESFDSTLKLEGGTSFEVKGVDGPFRATARPGPTARIVAGADRPKAAFFINVSIFTTDGSVIDVATLQSLFTEQIVPALRFP